MSDLSLATIAEPTSCPRCGAVWAAATVVNYDAGVDLNQIATPRVVYACGSTLHTEDHKDFEVPNREVQTQACLMAELAKHRGT